MDEFLRQFDTIRFVTPWSFFWKFFIFLNLNLNFEYGPVSYRTKPEPDRFPPVWWTLPLCHFVVKLLKSGPEHIIKQSSSAWHKYNQSRSKGMYQVHSGPQSVTNHSTKARTDLRSITRPWINVTRQRRTETCQSQADRPRWGRPA